MRDMINLDYQLSPSWNRNADSPDFSTLDATDLRYSVIMGDITMVVNGKDFSAPWGWIPIIDFAASLQHVSAELSQDASVETEFEFTESEATIHFKRLDDSISISASYAPSTAQISLTEFTNAVARFSAKVADELPQRYPSLLKNQAFVENF